MEESYSQLKNWHNTKTGKKQSETGNSELIFGALNKYRVSELN